MVRTITDNACRVWKYDDAESVWQHGEHLIGCGANNRRKWQVWSGPNTGHWEFNTLREAMSHCMDDVTDMPTDELVRVASDPSDNWFSLSYAYATSDSATEYGFANTGCFLVSECHPGEPNIVDTCAFEYGADALDYVNKLSALGLKPLRFSIFGSCQDAKRQLAQVERMKTHRFVPTAEDKAEEQRQRNLAATDEKYGF